MAKTLVVLVVLLSVFVTEKRIQAEKQQPATKYEAAVTSALQELDVQYVAKRRQQEKLFNCGTPMVELMAQTKKLAKEAGATEDQVRKAAAKLWDEKAAAKRYDIIREREKRQEKEWATKLQREQEAIKRFEEKEKAKKAKTGK